MELKDLVRVFVKGGIVSPGDFLKIILVAEKLGATYIHFGSRQDILFPAKERSKKILDDTFSSINTDYEINSFGYQNILSSFAALDIMQGKPWLASHIYHYLLDSFDYRPKFRINIVDSSQSLVPLFTGDINFIASDKENYWYVYFGFREVQQVPCEMPMLVYSEDLNKLAKAVEESGFLSKGWSYQELWAYLMETVQLNIQPVTEQLQLPEPGFPYYEGINRNSDGKYWLGLYWRNNRFDTKILKGIMERCLHTKVGVVNLTPWKSFIVKGIFEKDRAGWEKLMGKYGMNLRHSALELNWHIPALDDEALELKRFLVRELDQFDISTYGLTFTIKTNSDTIPFTSIIIQKNEDHTYDILHSKGFNPNVQEYVTYAREIGKNVLPPLIVELSLVYYEGLTEDPSGSVEARTITDNIQKDLYQCSQCMTVYDPTYGDSMANVPLGTLFSDLPDSYVCATCGGPKKEFRRMILN